MEEEKRIIAVDFSGTLIRPFVAEEANKRRYDILGIQKPDEKEHKRQHGDKSHYDIIKQHISDSYGISKNMSVSYRQNQGNLIYLSGKDVTTMIMTDLFRNAMYAVAKISGQDIFTEGILGALHHIKKRGYALAIVSGIRQDIISGMLAITNCPVSFEYIFGQDPILSKDDNFKQFDELKKKGNITHCIGDKLSDLEPGKKVGATTIFFKNGHPTGGEEEFAEYTISSAQESLDIIK